MMRPYCPVHELNKGITLSPFLSVRSYRYLSQGQGIG